MSDMTVRLHCDERYPVYTVHDGPYGLEVEATPDQVRRWVEATTAFNAAQDEMDDLYEAAAEKARVEDARKKAEREAKAEAERKRVAAERRRLADERDAKFAALEQRLATTGRAVYDDDGNQIGTINASGRIEPC